MPSPVYAIKVLESAVFELLPLKNIFGGLLLSRFHRFVISSPNSHEFFIFNAFI